MIDLKKSVAESNDHRLGKEDELQEGDKLVSLRVAKPPRPQSLGKPVIY